MPRQAPDRPASLTCTNPSRTTTGDAPDSARFFSANQRVDLLVSVRSAEEAASLAPLPVDILDIKEPDAGPLGAASPDLWHTCVTTIPFTGHWSVALGEGRAACEIAGDVPPQVAFAKAGPAGLQNISALSQLWSQLRQRLPASVELVAVAYADHAAANSPDARQILRAARELGFTKLLIDTYLKAGQTSFDALSNASLKALAGDARCAGIQLVLAGSLGFTDIPAIRELGIAHMGVRGCLCPTGRNGRIDPTLAKSLLELLGPGAEPAPAH